jgi:hypothetical protein
MCESGLWLRGSQLGGKLRGNSLWATAPRPFCDGNIHDTSPRRCTTWLKGSSMSCLATQEVRLNCNTSSVPRPSGLPMFLHYKDMNGIKMGIMPRCRDPMARTAAHTGDQVPRFRQGCCLIHSRCRSQAAAAETVFQLPSLPRRPVGGCT